jgi:C1A family cysteine protease
MGQLQEDAWYFEISFD